MGGVEFGVVAVSLLTLVIRTMKLMVYIPTPMCT